MSSVPQAPPAARPPHHPGGHRRCGSWPAGPSSPKAAHRRKVWPLWQALCGIIDRMQDSQRVPYFARLPGPSPLPSGLSEEEVEAMVRDSIRREGDDAPAVVDFLQEGLLAKGFRFGQWVSASLVEGGFEVHADSVVLGVSVTWNVPHRCW
jgi:hypothetical protein